MRLLSEYAREFVARPERFRTSLRHPVLVWEAAAISDEAPEADLSEVTVDGLTSNGPTEGDPVVLALKSSATGPAVGVTVGRSESNDAVIPNPTVSRVHALVDLDARTGIWRLCDMGSRNGSSVNGQPAAREQLVALSDGARVRIGKVDLRFYLPDSFIEYLKSWRGPAGASG